MKSRTRKVVNFFAFNLLFFALYLNFIHKDKAATTTHSIESPTAINNGTIPVSNPENYLNKVGTISDQHSDNKAATKSTVN
jgi:hypothetical protein